MLEDKFYKYEDTEDFHALIDESYDLLKKHFSLADDKTRVAFLKFYQENNKKSGRNAETLKKLFNSISGNIIYHYNYFALKSGLKGISDEYRLLKNIYPGKAFKIIYYFEYIYTRIIAISIVALLLYIVFYLMSVLSN